ncbi:MAG: rubredoxin-NAD+ reductase [Oleiphilaceae bacterium]|jgi:rubredoxin-NAD+ reductase
MDSALPIVIIGTGLAGYSLVREFRKLNRDAPILMLTRDDGHSYSKPMLSTGFTKGKSADAISLADPGKMASQLNISIRNFTEVSRIDPDSNTLHMGSEVLAYQQLVLANGASANTLNFKGSDHANILSINDLMDYRSFREKLVGKQRVLVMGAGLIGCEYANDLLYGDFQITVVDPAETALHGLIPSFAGNAVIQGLERKGVQFMMQCCVEEVIAYEDHLVAILSDGQQVTTDLIISAVGIKPELTLAKSAGLECDKGVVTNRFLETSRADIYALGDCAQIDGYVLLYVLPLMASARALAKTLNGERTAVSFSAMPVVIKTPACPVVVSPALAQNGEWQVEQDDININARYVNQRGETEGFVLTGECVSAKQSLIKGLKGIHH